MITGNQLGKVLEERGLFWRHSGDIRRPHAILSSEKHADGFVSIREMSDDPHLLQQITQSLIARLAMEIGDEIFAITTVAGSGYASVGLVQQVALSMGVRWLFTDKVDPNGNEMVCKFSVSPNEVFLLVEDMQTTFHTSAATMRTVWAVQPTARFCPVTLCAFTWEGKKDHLPPWMRIVPLLTSKMTIWDVPGGKVCELCQKGSEAIKPKGNWAKLTGK